MGTVSSIFNATDAAKAAGKEMSKTGDFKAIATMYTRVKSIASQASKYVMEYPVACTSSITDIKTALAIAKQVEFDCARFILLAAGLNPLIDSGKDDTIEAHLNRLVTSYESHRGPMCMIIPATEEHLESVEDYMYNVYSNECYDNSGSSRFAVNSNEIQLDPVMIKDEFESFTTESLDVHSNFSADNNDAPTNKNIKSWLANTKDNKTASMVTQDNIGDLFDIRFPRPPEPPPNASDMEKDAYNAYMTEYNERRDEVIKAAGITTASSVSVDYSNSTANAFRDLGRVKPTIITIKFILADGNGVMRDFLLPLAIKANLHFMHSTDVKDLLTKVDSPGERLRTFIKLTSGEMAFFKDWLFGVTEANKDVEREKNIGNTPMYRMLMSNKSRNKIKSVTDIIPKLKSFISGKTQKDLPMCTVVITESELTELTKFKLNYLLKDKRFINYVLDTYMLLGLGIVDEINDVMYFFYSGEPDYNIIHISELANRSPNDRVAETLAKTVQEMQRLISRR